MMMMIMLTELTKFSGKLRENGIPISIRSTQNACKVIPLIKDRNKCLKEALACVYIKDQNQREKFDELYTSFFEGKKEKKDQTNKDKTKKSKNQVKNRSNQRTEFSSKFKTYPNVKTTDSNDYRMDMISDQISNEIKQEYIDTMMEGSGKNTNNEESNLLQNNLMTLNTPNPQLIELCRQLGRKIANKRVNRYKQSKKFKPDIRRTIRKNLIHGGTLLEIVKSKPKIKKQDYYFLSDVSVSCDWISIWFFCMVYVAQNTFSKTNVFEFDNKTTNITQSLNEQSLIEAFTKVLNIRYENQMINGKSNMNTAFDSFIYQTNLNNKSYVLILSDCRDWAGPKYKDKPLSADKVKIISERTKRVLILNPEPKNKWNVGDSCVSDYENAGAEIFEVSNLNQLADVISEI